MALLVLDLDRPAVLIERRADVKDMQCARDVEEQRYMREVPPRADPNNVQCTLALMRLQPS